MPQLYLIRHGIAVERDLYPTDEERPLTEKGRQKTVQVAKRLHQLGLRFDLILTSPLVRACQTGEILQAASLSSHLENSPFLAPGGEIESWIAWWEKWQRKVGGDRLAVVGHQPDLGNWAEMLVWGTAQEKLDLKKAGIIGLSLPKTGTPLGRSQMFWLTAPKWLL